jgi:hypothetical protein
MALIDDPILNSPFREPTRHFKFDDEGITNEICRGAARLRRRGRKGAQSRAVQRDVKDGKVEDATRQRRRARQRGDRACLRYLKKG